MFNQLKFVAFLVLFFSCQSGEVKKLPIPEKTIKKETPESKSTNKPDRAAWQKPDFVISKLGNLEGKTVADIGAGLGYFTFRLAFKAEKVIGIDIDTDMIETMNVLKNNLPADIQTRIEARLAQPDNPMLAAEEVDCAIIVNTIAYIDNQVEYLQNLKKGLKKGGMLMIMDFKLKNLPSEVAPPIENRMSLYELENELAAAGYNEIVSDDTSLEYQYIIFAYK